jgi:hypothetical protein
LNYQFNTAIQNDDFSAFVTETGFKG